MEEQRTHNRSEQDDSVLYFTPEESAVFRSYGRYPTIPGKAPMTSRAQRMEEILRSKREIVSNLEATERTEEQIWEER